MGRRRKSKSIILNKYKLWTSFIALWWIFFFSFYLAEGSPIFVFLQEYASVPFGEIWLLLFFALCILVGIMILAKWHLIKLLIKQFLLVMIIISAILNFPTIDWDSTQYEQLWWYISWPLIYLLNTVFGNNALAIKVFIIILLILLVWWILYTFNFSLPRININIRQDQRPNKSNKTNRQEDNDIAKRISKVRNKSQQDNEKYIEEYKPQTISKSFVSTLLKKKVEDKIQDKDKKPRPVLNFSWEKPTFMLNILESWDQKISIDESFLMEKAKSLQNKLLEFNVPIMIEWFDIWPSIVQIRIKPESGIKITTIEWLTNDIAMSLKCKSLRIIAPIPGTDCVWIQIPNPKPSMVRVADILWTDEFQESIKNSDTNLTLGKAIDWSVIVKTLESMPHLLVAWATWSGKSVGVNDFILSLMYQNTPSELKFLMVDPKQVELELYSGLPYLLAPIVFESDKALKLLKRAVNEMERRYSLLKEKRVKNIDEYNSKIIWEKIYRIVFVIDELADMMMSGNKKDVETCITRIAQKARAVGIHLIVATQRPSVNVITGLIKANIPTRIAFGVVSEIDSRTIIGRKWAEALLGKWDLLYIDPSTKHPIRIQAPFVSTEEIEKVVQTLKNKYMWGLTEDDIYNPEIVQMLESKLETGDSLFGWWNGNDDELIEQAIQVIAETRKASATLLQRKLGVWFARAARIMDQMEERGIIWPQDWAKPRDIFL